MQKTLVKLTQDVIFQFDFALNFFSPDTLKQDNGQKEGKISLEIYFFRKQLQLFFNIKI